MKYSILINSAYGRIPMNRRGRPISTDKVAAKKDIENGMGFHEWTEKWGFSRQTYYNWKEGKTLNVSLSLHPELYEEIRAMAELRGITISESIREGIQLWLGKKDSA